MGEAVLAGKRILVVEDDVTNMAIIVVLLRHHGAVVVQDPWNAETLHVITRHMPIDIILLDLMLRHQVSGYDIFKRIKEIPEFAAIPIVVVSASDPAVEIPKAQELGFAGFISKPIDARTFPEQVLCCIEQQPVWG